jgi:hypothetical protein
LRYFSSLKAAAPSGKRDSFFRKLVLTQTLKPRVEDKNIAARLKSCPVAKHGKLGHYRALESVAIRVDSRQNFIKIRHAGIPLRQPIQTGDRSVPKTQSNPLNFKAELTGRGPSGAWTYLRILFSVDQVFGRKGQVPVRATVNGFTFRNSLMPRGDGTHILGIGKDILAGAGAATGDTVAVELAIDDAPRTVAVPADLEAALASAPGKAQAFGALSYSHKKEFVDWIESAKRPETRISRIEKAVEMAGSKKTPKG